MKQHCRAVAVLLPSRTRFRHSAAIAIAFETHPTKRRAPSLLNFLYHPIFTQNDIAHDCQPAMVVSAVVDCNVYRHDDGGGTRLFHTGSFTAQTTNEASSSSS
jgi:hypothetical protein